jgi:uncharacterized membrane protein YdbT with pleckstrin-like domain
MAYPENVLAAEENLLLHRHPHWTTVIGALLLGAILTGIAAVGFWWFTVLALVSPWGLILNIVLGVLLAVALIWWVFAPMIRWATTHFVITDQRVMYRTGVFTRSGIDIPLLRINTVQFEHGFIDRIFRTGTLIIESASDDPLSFKHVPNVEKVHSLLYSQLNNALDGNDR